MKVLWQLFITFLKVGTFTFGGGLAMLPVIRSAVVDEKKWLTDEEIIDCFSVSQSLPGVLALNSSIYVGNKVKGLGGAVVAALGVALPAFISILVFVIFLKQAEDNQYVKGAFEAVQAASVGLILVTTVNMARKIMVGLTEIIIAIASFLLIVVAGVSAVWGIIVGGVAGYVVYILKKAKIARGDR